ncbi:TspO/MBR family protein [Natronolimnohabitans innermongolicus]|uniref:TspO and MBR-like protein n=1 Tax=Natronolimnohabitans innermongolicus JCM 12255 TaxID=1227499 RepID=L9WZB7_9EURY|nr:TspO/MBR family protein [Natronolimnohabitans innermongolicus]ELY54839.1 TspO and MBR-like protein [Natronolimnohabitans innermongolicus JCM 12255]
MASVFARAAQRVPDRRPLLQAVGFVVLVNLIGSLPGVLSSPGSAWFQALEKPWFYPPGIAFSVVWTALFTLLGVALWLVWRSDAAGRRLALGLFAVQLAVNVTWTPTFFSLEAPLAALGIILLLWVLVAATIAAFRRVDRRAAALLVPYLAWVTFAAVLNFEIWRLNA